MIKLEHVPHGLQKINEWFGGCPAHVRIVNGKQQVIKDPTWGKRNTKQIELPFPLRLSYNRTLVIKNPWVHKLVADSLIDALLEIMNYAGYEFLVKNNLDITGGIGSTRLMKSATDRLSMHAYFAAIDICPDLGPYGEPSRMPFFIHEAFIDRGWVNLTMEDGMHFQAAGGY